MKQARVIPSPDGMNGLERAYSAMLEAGRLNGDIQTWRFEPVTFRLGHACRYTPDFEVVAADGTLAYHEVKGYWRDDARVKIKVAARLFRDRRFVAVQLKRKVWTYEEIKPSGI